MKPFHILNGDCLAEQLTQSNINQDFIVCRECLVEGDVLASNLEQFWQKRADFISQSYQVSTDQYFHNTVGEFDKLNKLPGHSEICLWFENDLFCQVNLWFVISLIETRSWHKVYRVFPIIDNAADTWKGFGISDAKKLEHAFHRRVQFTPQDLQLGKNLWDAFQQNDFEKLKEISNTPSDCFQFLEEVCKANIDRFPADNTPGEPDQVVREILGSGTTDFQDVFSEFSSRLGIYGFSDLQVRAIYNQQLRNL